MIWNNLIIEDKINVTGRGTILIVDLQKSGVVKNKLMHSSPIKEDDIIIDGETKYQVRGIELSRIAMDFYENIKSNIGIQVKQVF